MRLNAMSQSANPTQELAELIKSVRGNDDVTAFWNAVGGLGILLPQVDVAHVLQLLEDSDENIQSATVHGLGVVEDGVKDVQLIPALLRIATAGRCERTRETALRQLGNYSTPEIFELLKQLERVANGPRPIRHLIAEQLRAYDSEEAVDLLIKLLDDPDVYVQEPAIDSLAVLNRPRLAKLWERIAPDWSGTRWEGVARSAIESLQAMPPDDASANALVTKMVSRAEALLASSEPDARAEGLRRLMYLRPETLGDTLLACLDDSSSDVRAAAALGLGNIHDLRAPELLKRLVKSDTSWRVRSNAILALGKFHCAETLQFFLDEVWHSEDTTPDVRCALALVLPEYDSEEVVDALLDLLKDNARGARNEAADSLLILNRPRLRTTWQGIVGESSAAGSTAREALEALDASLRMKGDGS